MSAIRDIDAGILGRLLVIQQTLPSLPDPSGITSFLGSALRDMPGLTALHFYDVDGVHPPSPELSALPAKNWKSLANAPSEVHGFCGISDLSCFPVRTNKSFYGALVVKVGDAESFSGFSELVVNIAGILASELERRAHLREISAANEELKRAGENLEEMVKKRTAELQLAKEQADEAIKIKDKFVSIVAHDLRAPVANVVAFLKFLAMGDSVPMTETQKDLLDKLIDNTTGMFRVIDELVSIGRLRSGKIPLNKVFLNAAGTAATAIASLSYLAEKKGIKIENLVDPGARVHADQVLFGEVLKNLLSNSIKFCGKGDKVTFFTPAGLPSAIGVRDTGTGIKPYVMKDIFKYEIKTTTPGTANETGTGFGLPYSFDIMAAHGGTLKAESEEGKGAVFFAQLPPVSPSVLLIDNDEVPRTAVKNLLFAKDVAVREAGDLAGAMKNLMDDPPDLILADVALPGMEVLDLLSKTKKNPSISKIPVVVMSGGDAAMNDNLMRLGADLIVPKPVRPDTLAEGLRRFIG